MDGVATQGARLIVDFHERSLFAALAMPRGQIERVLYSHARRHSPYLPCEWPLTFEAPAATTDRAPVTVAPDDLLGQLGVLLNADDARAAATSPGHPIDILSSPEAMAVQQVKGVLSRVGLAILSRMLDPLFTALSRHGLTAGTLEALLVVPSWTGRRVTVLLRSVFRSRGIRRVRFVHREVAAALLVDPETTPECVVLDVTQTETHLHRMHLERTDGVLRVHTLASRSVPGIGWNTVVSRLADNLQTEGLPARAPLRDAERALFGLLGGPYAAEIGSWPLTFEFVNRWLHMPAGLLDEGASALGVASRDLGVEGFTCVPIGLACMLTEFERRLARAAHLSLAAHVTRYPSLERCAMAIANTRAAAAPRGQHHIQFGTAASLRLSNLHADSAILMPSEHLALQPGERRRFRRVLRTQGATTSGAPVLLNLLWGCNPTPERNVSLCALPLPPDSSSAGVETPIILTVDLKRGVRHLHGRVTANRGTAVVAGRLEFGPASNSNWSYASNGGQ